MTTRLHRLWQPGGAPNRVFLPNFWMRIVESKLHAPPNVVKFEISKQMTAHDVREYLTKLYKLPVREVRVDVEMGKMLMQNDGKYGSVREDQHRRWGAMFMKYIDKEEDVKYGYVVFRKDISFTFPNVYVESELRTEYEKIEKKQEKENKSEEEQKYNRPVVKQPGIPKWFS